MDERNKIRIEGNQIKNQKRTKARITELVGIMCRLWQGMYHDQEFEEGIKALQLYTLRIPAEKEEDLRAALNAERVLREAQAILKNRGKVLQSQKKVEKQTNKLLKQPVLDIPQLIALNKQASSVDPEEFRKKITGKYILFNGKRHKITSYLKHRTSEPHDLDHIRLDENFPDPIIIKHIEGVRVITDNNGKQVAWIPLVEGTLKRVLSLEDEQIVADIAQEKPVSARQFIRYIHLIRKSKQDVGLITEEIKKTRPLVRSKRNAQMVVDLYVEHKGESFIHLVVFPYNVYIRLNEEALDFALDNFPVLKEIDGAIKMQHPFNMQTFADIVKPEFEGKKIDTLIPHLHDWGGFTEEHQKLLFLAIKHMTYIK